LKLLTDLDLSGNRIQLLPPTFRNLSNIVELNFQGEFGEYQLSQEACTEISYFLADNHVLKNLILERCEVGEGGAILIFTTLLKNYDKKIRTLRRFKIEDFKLNDYTGLETIPMEIVKEGTKKIADFITDLFSKVFFERKFQN
jgi:hypothetical protein